MLSTSDFRVGSTFEMDGKLVSVVAVEHIKMARAGAVIKAKLRNLLDGAIFEQSFRSGDKYRLVRIEKSAATFLVAAKLRFADPRRQDVGGRRHQRSRSFGSRSPGSTGSGAGSGTA